SIIPAGTGVSVAAFPDVRLSARGRAESTFRKVLKRILLQKNVFPPWIFFNKLQEYNEELGLIIDLTYARRYYKLEINGTRN
ncbi:hypothetical protein EI555_004727, partial [Monodon monoceros]